MFEAPAYLHDDVMIGLSSWVTSVTAELGPGGAIAATGIKYLVILLFGISVTLLVVGRLTGGKK